MSGANGAVSPADGAGVHGELVAEGDTPADAGRAAGADDVKTVNGGFEEVLDVVRRSATDLLREAAHLPSVLRVRAGDVAVEMEWPTATAAAPIPAPITSAAPAAPAAPSSPTDPPGTTAAAEAPALRAPMVGVFYAAPEPGAPPFVRPGDRIAVGQQVAIIEAMKLMVPVHAEQAGVVTGVLVADATPVEYGDPLFSLEPAGR